MGGGGREKGKPPGTKREKVKSQTRDFHPDLTRHTHRAHARTTRNDFPVELSPPTSNIASFRDIGTDFKQMSTVLSTPSPQKKQQQQHTRTEETTKNHPGRVDRARWVDASCEVGAVRARNPWLSTNLILLLRKGKDLMHALMYYYTSECVLYGCPKF